MGNFTEALISKEKSSLIPDEYDYWGELIGSWDIDYVEGKGTAKEKHVKGEWYFERILEGLGIQDIFICPAREYRDNPKTGEYGATIRMFNPQKMVWDMVYTCYGTMSRFTGTKKDGMVILTNNHKKTNRWIFTDITKNSFHWQNESTLKDGTVKVWCEVFATRQTI